MGVVSACYAIADVIPVSDSRKYGVHRLATVVVVVVVVGVCI